MSIYVKTSSGAFGLTPYGFSEIYEKTNTGTDLLYQSTLPYLLLYGDGDMQTAVTGGWSKGYAESYCSVSLNNTTTGLTYYSNLDDQENYNDRYTTIATENLIDVTEYNQLSFTIKALTAISANRMIVGGRTNRTQSTSNTIVNFAFYHKVNSSITKGSTTTLTIDVSGTTGSYYISIALYTGLGLKLTECKLIK